MGKIDNPYIGKDGRDYRDTESLRQANQDWKEANLRFIGPNGESPAMGDVALDKRSWNTRYLANETDNPPTGVYQLFERKTNFNNFLKKI